MVEWAWRAKFGSGVWRQFNCRDNSAQYSLVTHYGHNAHARAIKQTAGGPFMATSKAGREGENLFLRPQHFRGPFGLLSSRVSVAMLVVTWVISSPPNSIP